MSGKPHFPSLKSFVISAPVQREMDAQRDGPPQRIPIIVCLNESEEHPESGVQPSKQKVKDFLSGKSDPVSESDFRSEGPPQRIPIIVCLNESEEHPESGVQPSKQKVKDFLSGKSDPVSESDF